MNSHENLKEEAGETIFRTTWCGPVLSFTHRYNFLCPMKIKTSLGIMGAFRHKENEPYLLRNEVERPLYGLFPA